MGYVYSFLWFAAAFLLFFRFRKESAAVYVLCVYFLFFGAWWLADNFTEADLLRGTYAWVLRIVSAAALAAAAVTYRIEKNIRSKRESESSGDD